RTLRLSLSLGCGLLLAVPEAAEYRISGPYTHDNLSIFLIHGQSGGKSYVPLKEALEQKKVIVYETHNVQELAIENLSEHDVFVQGGDIVKGGQQDRVITNDFVLPSKSGKVPISAFCVEPVRWATRGAEPQMRFSGAAETIVNKDMAMAVKSKKNQSEVWKEVAKAQDALGVGARTAGVNESVSVAASPSSLQLTLESRGVTKAVE